MIWGGNCNIKFIIYLIVLVNWEMFVVWYFFMYVKNSWFLNSVNLNKFV